MKAILTVGCSGSGKSTWASMQKNVFVINRDEIRWEVSGVFGWKEYKFNKETEKRVTEIQHSRIKEAAANGMDIIIADTNLNLKIRENIFSFCMQHGYEVEYKEFPATLEELWNRDRFRGVFSVGRDVLYKQWQNWLEYSCTKKYVPNESLPKAIIFDVDGTLAHMNGKRGPFEWSKVGGDTVDTLVRELLWSFQKRGYKIIIMSGRDSVCREETFQWMENNFIIYDGMYMRKQDDMRKDGVIKTELFWEHVAPYYNVVACVDDRPAMIRAWYDLGIPKVFAVGDPSLEF